MPAFHIAQINVARMKGVNKEDPVMKEFTDNLDRVNELADTSEGFIWRLKDDSNNATSFSPADDVQLLINVSVWESIESLEHFTYRTFHSDFVRRRKEWFHQFGKAYYALWWIPAGQLPTLEEALAKLDKLQSNGPSSLVFDFKNRYPPQV